MTNTQKRRFILPDSVYQTDGTRVYESKVTKVIYRTENFDFDEDAIGARSS